MSDTLAPLILDFLEWIAAGPRDYAEVMDTWRTSCPRLTVWEDAVDRGLVATTSGAGGCRVSLTPAGRNLLSEVGRSSASDIHAAARGAPAEATRRELADVAEELLQE